MRAVLLVVGVALVSGALMVASILLTLPVAFETQGVGWRAAPLRSVLVWLGSALLAPLAWLGAASGPLAGGPGWGLLGGMLALSVAYGLLALGFWTAWRARRR